MDVWDEMYKNGRDFRQLTTSQVQILADCAKSSKSTKYFLDIGCGTGGLVRELFHSGYMSDGVDTSSVAIAIANQSSHYVGNDINYVVGDISVAPRDTYDLIICKYVLAFVADRPTFYMQVKEKMDTSSVFVVISPQLETLPEVKKDIAIDDSVLTLELQVVFGNVEKRSYCNNWWYICHI